MRQADPISPLLFNYAWDVLVGMFRKEHDGGLICGLVPHPVDKGTCITIC
jgi:hypothetical protein